MTTNTIAELHELLFAPWVKQLGLELVDANAAPDPANSEGADIIRFSMPVNAQFHRSDVSGGSKGGGVLCGQALAAASDTVSVLALAVHNDGFRECTTTDLNIRFMRPIMTDSVLLDVKVLSSGRRMAVTEVCARVADNPKVHALASCAFAYLADS